MLQLQPRNTPPCTCTRKHRPSLKRESLQKARRNSSRTGWRNILILQNTTVSRDLQTACEVGERDVEQPGNPMLRCAHDRMLHCAHALHISLTSLSAQTGRRFRYRLFRPARGTRDPSSSYVAESPPLSSRSLRTGAYEGKDFAPC